MVTMESDLIRRLDKAGPPTYEFSCPPRIGPVSQPTYAIASQKIEPQRPAPGLYIVATPIGNLRDITLRALDILAAADLLLCEDTRHTARLCEAYAIKTPRSPLHDHNERARIDEILVRLENGEVVALVSDAGTPLLSDPGFPLVRAARESQLPVFPVPGPSALLAALTGAGLPTDAFSFLGFLPPKTGQRVNALTPLATRAETLVFYESPRRLGAALADMADVFGPERQAVVALELTKKFERFLNGTLTELAEHFAGDTKGEALETLEEGLSPAQRLRPQPGDQLPHRGPAAPGRRQVLILVRAAGRR
jgi:16S rRNA (cytidine1402-2'-O)-methyltransferase